MKTRFTSYPSRIPRVALVGVGGYGAVHLKMLQLLQSRGQAEIIAVADPFVRKNVENFLLLRKAGLNIYDDDLALYANEEVDFVAIASPIHLHEGHIKSALTRGINIYTEKPPVPTIAQLQSLIKGDPLQKVSVGFQMLMLSQVKQLKSWIASGALGDVEKIVVTGGWPRERSYYNRASWAGKMFYRGVPVFDGPATNALSHLVHTTMYLASPDPRGFATPVWVRGSLYKARPIESYDLAVICGKCDTQTQFEIFLTHATNDYSSYTIRVQGSRAHALLESDGQHLSSSNSLSSNFIYENFEQGLYSNLAWSLSALSNELKPSSTLKDCLGYSLATSGALISSGGVREVPDRDVTVVNPGDRDEIFHVQNTEKALSAASEGGLESFLRELPWMTLGDKVETPKIVTSHFNDEVGSPQEATIVN